MVWVLSIATFGSAQATYRGSSAGRIDAGTAITVRTTDQIDTRQSDGRVYMAVVDQDVLDRSNRVAVPRGSDAELIVRRDSNNQIAVDLDSIMVNGQRFGVQTTESTVVESERKEGIGANERTGKYVGGGAVIGAIIGAITGGGKGAAIGAGAGAAAGAGAQVLTRGSSVRIPAETLLTFRLAQSMTAPTTDGGYLNNGYHYHRGYPDSYESSSDITREKPSAYSTARGTINIGSDRFVRWDGPDRSSIFVQVDNEAPKLFASGRSGTQEAPWITPGHVYVFMLRDARGNEVARDRQDLRNDRNRRDYRR